MTGPLPIKIKFLYIVEWRETSKGGKNIKDAGKGEGHSKDRTA